MLIIARKCLQTLPRGNIPDLDRGVCITRHQDIVPQLHPGGERLVAHERMLASPGLDVPDSDGRIQRAGDHMNAVKL